MLVQTAGDLNEHCNNRKMLLRAVTCTCYDHQTAPLTIAWILTGIVNLIFPYSPSSAGKPWSDHNFGQSDAWIPDR